MSDFNNTVQTVTFRAGSGFETQEITLEFFDDALTESLTEFYILVVRLDNSSQNNAADVLLHYSDTAPEPLPYL